MIAISPTSLPLTSGPVAAPASRAAPSRHFGSEGSARGPVCYRNDRASLRADVSRAQRPSGIVEIGVCLTSQPCSTFGSDRESYLKSIFEKTCVRRQADLVKQAAGAAHSSSGPRLAAPCAMLMVAWVLRRGSQAGCELDEIGLTRCCGLAEDVLQISPLRWHPTGPAARRRRYAAHLHDGKKHAQLAS